MYVNKNLANAYFVMGSRLYMKSGNKTKRVSRNILLTLFYFREHF